MLGYGHQDRNQMTETAIIDTKALERLQEWGGKRLVAQMIDLFLTQTPGRMENLREGLQSGDAEVVERAAHSLKSTAANLGAGELAEIAARIEKMAGTRDLDAVRRDVPAIEAEFQRALDALAVMEGGAL